jgi:hypothetical protein
MEPFELLLVAVNKDWIDAGYRKEVRGGSRYSCDSIGRMPRNPIPTRFQNPV